MILARRKTSFTSFSFIRTAGLLPILFTIAGLLPNGPALGSAHAATSLACGQSGAETVATNKADYAPEETVHITGSGYQSSCNVAVRVTRPDGSVITGDGSGTLGSDSVLTGADGSLSYDYKLDGIQGSYTVDVLGAGDVVLASTTFTDSIFLSFRINAVLPGIVAGDEAAHTPSLNVTLTLTVLQFEPPATQMRLKNFDGTNLNCSALAGGFGAWEPLAATKNWNLEAGGAGPRYVCAQIASGPLGDPTPFTVATMSDSITFAAFPVAFFDTFEQPGATASNLIRGWVDGDGALGFCKIETFLGTEFLQLSGAIDCSTAQVIVSTVGLQSIMLDYSRARCGGLGAGTGNLNVFWRVSGVPPFLPLVSDAVPDLPFALRTEGLPAGANNTLIDIAFVFPGTGCVLVDDVRVYGTPITTFSTTAIHEHPGHVAATAFDLGDRVHDRAAITFPGGGATPVGSLFTFQLLKDPGPTCSVITGQTTILSSDDVAAAGLASGGFVESPPSGLLGLSAGGYAYRVTFTSGDTAALSNAGPVCEPFTVNKANTTSTTQVHSPHHFVVTALPLGTDVHDKISVSGRVNGFPFDGKADFRLYNGTGCVSANQIELAGDLNVSITDNGNGNAGTAESAARSLGVGAYSYQATYRSDPNYNDSVGACEPFYIVPRNAVTSSSLCTFDVNTGVPGSQFRLIFTPDHLTSAWKLNASNPGQIFYNVFHYSGSAETVSIALPYPFVTQGATPIHTYSTVTPSFNSETCFTPGTGIGSLGTQVTLASYTGPGDTEIVDVAVPAGFSYINIHLNYGLKGTTGYTPSSKLLDHPDALKAGGNIPNDTPYTFAFTDGNSGLAIVRNENVFKNDPGIGGLVLKAVTGDPVANVQVRIYGASNNLLATVYTDADGWYMWAYKYTGKRASFTVNLPAYSLSQTVTLKSNGFLVVNFTVP